MNIALQILQLLLNLMQALASGKAQQDANVAAILLQIIQKGVQGYEDHTGETLDPALIKSENLP